MSAARKPKRAAKTRETTEPAVDLLKKAQATLAIPVEALTDVNPDPQRTNPFIQLTGARDTVNYVRCGLEYLSRVKATDEAVSSDADCQFGLHLLMQTMENALRVADAQILDECKRARAHGIVEATRGIVDSAGGGES